VQNFILPYRVCVRYHKSGFFERSTLIGVDDGQEKG